MAQVVIVIPDAHFIRVIDGIGKYHGYKNTIEDNLGNPIPNPESSSQFAKRMVITTIKNWVKNVEGEVSAEIARKASVTDVETINVT